MKDCFAVRTLVFIHSFFSLSLFLTCMCAHTQAQWPTHTEHGIRPVTREAVCLFSLLCLLHSDTSNLFLLLLSFGLENS